MPGVRAGLGGGTADALPPCMRGYITEANFEECEEEFPGIVDFYRNLAVKPRTFLELMHAYLDRESRLCARSPARRSVTLRRAA
jgi:hypothetical protein